MSTATIANQNRKQTVDMPQHAAFPIHIKEVEVIVVGNTRILTPRGERWQVWASRPSQLSEDCFAERGQDGTQNRQGFDE